MTEGAKISIGRDVGNDVVLNDRKISKEHATVIWENGEFSVIDLDSTNGTFVNEGRITGQVPLGNGDQISIGKFTLKYIDKKKPADDISSKVTQVEELDVPEKHQDIQVDDLKTKIYKLPQDDSIALVEEPPQKPATGRVEKVETIISDPQPADDLLKMVRTPSEDGVVNKEETDMAEAIYVLVEKLNQAQSAAENLGSSWQTTRANLEELKDRLETTSEKLAKMQAESLNSGFIDTVDRLITKPNDVTSLVKLAEHAELLRARLEGFNIATETLHDVAADLEKEINQIPGG